MRNLVEGRRDNAVSNRLKKRSLRSRPSTALRAVPLPCKSRGGSFGLVAAALLAGICAAAPAQPPSPDSGRWPAVHSRVARDPAIEARIDAMLARMSLE